ncbi:MAG: patatin-like phospholipase family protein [Sandaracinaceae bacterium]|nr:patatin-like phospholipase family protein [Sandaracinaceae bacterium]
MSDPSQPELQTKNPARKRMGLCLTGGGITGAMYEVGCLAALEEFFEGFSAADFDVLVASSSGATVALALAGGHPAMRMYRALLDPADDFFPLDRSHLLRLDGSEWKRVSTSAVGAARRMISSITSRLLEVNVWDELDRFWDSLPAGFFTLDAYERFLEAFMTRRSIPASFDTMAHALLLVAYDLDRGERAVFGQGELAQVPVARATCAATAMPMLFAPVRIDGRDYIDGGMGPVAHADLAADAGCDVVVIVNPMVPVRADIGDKGVPTGHGLRRRVRDKGLIWVLSQAVRMRSEARLQEGLLRYGSEHPQTQIVLLEPDPDDATMFMYSPMNFAARRTILEDGYVRTTRQLKDEGSHLRRALETAGLVPKR